MEISAATMKINMDSSKDRNAAWSSYTIPLIPEEISLASIENCIPSFIVAQCTIAKLWNISGHQLMNE